MTEYDVTEAMIVYGGGFVAALGRLVRLADQDNKRRLVAAFPECFAKYRAMVARQAFPSLRDNCPPYDHIPGCDCYDNPQERENP